MATLDRARSPSPLDRTSGSENRRIHPLRKAMKNPALVIFALLAALPAAPSPAQSDACVGCKEAAPMTHREGIKAAREKFDLEIKRDSKRPWDGLDLGIRKLPSPPTPILPQ